jgi:hypothetical protein
MLTLKIEDEKVEQIFLNEFHSNKKKFFAFIHSSYEKMKTTNDTNNFIISQESSMQKTWENKDDEVWDAL